MYVAGPCVGFFFLKNHTNMRNLLFIIATLILISCSNDKVITTKDPNTYDGWTLEGRLDSLSRFTKKVVSLFPELDLRLSQPFVIVQAGGEVMFFDSPLAECGMWGDRFTEYVIKATNEGSEIHFRPYEPRSVILPKNGNDYLLLNGEIEESFFAYQPIEDFGLDCPEEFGYLVVLIQSIETIDGYGKVYFFGPLND